MSGAPGRRPAERTPLFDGVVEIVNESDERAGDDRGIFADRRCAYGHGDAVGINPSEQVRDPFESLCGDCTRDVVAQERLEAPCDGFSRDSLQKPEDVQRVLVLRSVSISHSLDDLVHLGDQQRSRSGDEHGPDSIVSQLERLDRVAVAIDQRTLEPLRSAGEMTRSASVVYSGTASCASPVCR
jgi:hypothetical protein